MSRQHSDNHQHHESWLFSRTGIATICALAILGLLVYTGHSAHLLGFLPYLLILACPLMHVFMHGGHHGHGDATNDQSHSQDGGCCGGGHEEHKQTDEAPLPSTTSNYTK